MKNLYNLEDKKEYIATVQQRGQVTIPLPIRKILNTSPQTKIVFYIKNATVKVRSTSLSLEDAFGYITKLNNKPQDFDKQIKIAKKEKAKRNY